jgi:hypothetical protein
MPAEPRIYNTYILHVATFFPLLQHRIHSVFFSGAACSAYTYAHNILCIQTDMMRIIWKRAISGINQFFPSGRPHLGNGASSPLSLSFGSPKPKTLTLDYWCARINCWLSPRAPESRKMETRAPKAPAAYRKVTRSECREQQQEREREQICACFD